MSRRIMKQAQLASNQQMVLKLGSGARSDRQIPSKLLHRLAARAFSNVGRYRKRGTRELISKAKSMAIVKAVRFAIETQRQPEGSLPYLKPFEIPHLAVIQQDQRRVQTLARYFAS